MFSNVNGLPMKYMNDQPAGLRVVQEGIVEVRLWEAFLLYNRHNVYSTLSTYDLDNGPENQKDHDLSMVTFHFTTWDWNKTLKRLLARHNIPVISEVVHLKEEAKFVRHI
jgi:hypothetical protein